MLLHLHGFYNFCLHKKNTARKNYKQTMKLIKIDFVSLFQDTFNF